jgi:AraC-like DNA-binding protein
VEKIPLIATVLSEEEIENMISIEKFYPIAKPLKNLIKYFWVFECPSPITLCHKLLPVNNIDIIFNLLSPMKFEKDGITFETPGNIYFRGLTKKHILMKQQGAVLTIGVSFFPAGLYPFFRIPISEFRDKTFSLNTIFKNATQEIESKLIDTDTKSRRIDLLEDFFLDQLDQNALLPLDTYKLLTQFSSSNMSINDFCLRNCVHPRTFERLFNKYIGTTPKLFSRLCRFQIILNNLINSPKKNLTTLAYEFDYFDQPHFIKDFESFSGSSPTNFIKEKQSIRQIIK